MKKLLCVLLITVCVLALASCDLLEQFLSYERVEATVNNNPSYTIPDENASENKKPYEDKTDATTPEKDHEQNKPNDDPNRDENNDGIPDIEQNTTQPGGNNPVAPAPNTITVSLTWQSGGVAMDTATITTQAPATLSHVYRLFAEERLGDSFSHSEVLHIDGIQINGKWVDASKVIYMNDGDQVYAVEWNAELPSHLHVWDGGMCVICHEECPHGEWNDDNICFFCKFECWHNEWIGVQCSACGKICDHSEWDGNRQCLICHEFLGVDLLQIEFYMDGEYCGCTSTIEHTVGEQLMYQFWRSWEDLTSTYDVYVGDLLVTDESYMILESCNIYLVTRSNE